MLKQGIKHILKAGRLKAYEQELKRQRISYPDWESRRERELFPVQKEPSLKITTYPEIRDLLLQRDILQAGDEELFLFCSEKGRLSQNALSLCAEFAESHPEYPLFYGDEDSLGEEGYENPFFKPDWSPDTFSSAFYIGSVFVVRERLLKRLSALPSSSGERAEADLLFSALAELAGGFEKRRGKAFPIGHLREVLFHRENGADLFYGRPHEGSELLQEPEDTGKAPLISVIIPSKDHPELLNTCISSLYRCGGEKQPYEVIIVDNGSSQENQERIRELLHKLPEDRGLTRKAYLVRPMAFHFSRMCNLGAEEARGELFLFLNDDIEAVVPGWLSGMGELALGKRTGAVGAKLYYPGGDLLQHAGITNVRLGPVHKLAHLSDSQDWYFGRNRGVHDVLGVTGACLMVEREKFREAGGFPEELPVAFNDVDLCYTLFELGYDNIQDNRVHAFHHESASRGLDTEDPAKIRRMAAEYDILMDRHPDMYHYDPYYHPFLIEDEHTSVFVFYQDGLTPSGLEELKPRAWKNTSPEGEYPGAKEDACLRLGVEYAGALENWEQGIRRGNAESGWLIKGYSFVIGSDNVCYERRLLLKKQSDSPGEVPRIWEVPVRDWYRPDIEQQTTDQQHTALCGFKTRIKGKSLEPGAYQLGMLALDKTSRQRLVSWVPNELIIKGD